MHISAYSNFPTARADAGEGVEDYHHDMTFRIKLAGGVMITSADVDFLLSHPENQQESVIRKFLHPRRVKTSKNSPPTPPPPSSKQSSSNQKSRVDWPSNCVVLLQTLLQTEVQFNDKV